jgi:hypothetical protein
MSRLGRHLLAVPLGHRWRYAYSLAATAGFWSVPGGRHGSFPLRTGLAITLALGLPAFAPLDGLARSSGGQTSGPSPRLHSTGHAYRSPAASSRGSTKCIPCECNRCGRIQRDRSAVDEFRMICPKTPNCTRCDLGLIVSGREGERNDAGNMQWRSREQHRYTTRRDLRR